VLRPHVNEEAGRWLEEAYDEAFVKGTKETQFYVNKYLDNANMRHFIEPFVRGAAREIFYRKVWGTKPTQTIRRMFETKGEGCNTYEDPEQCCRCFVGTGVRWSVDPPSEEELTYWVLHEDIFRDPRQFHAVLAAQPIPVYSLSTLLDAGMGEMGQVEADETLFSG
jgi:hypothetical protein